MQPTIKELEEVGKVHLDWLESQTLQMLGIDLFKVFSYELIQILNHQYLKGRLETHGDLELNVETESEVI